VRLAARMLARICGLVILDEPSRTRFRTTRRLLARARNTGKSHAAFHLAQHFGNDGFERVLVIDEGRVVEDAILDSWH